MGLLCSAPALRSGLEKEKMMFFPFCYFQSYISPDFRLDSPNFRHDSPNFRLDSPNFGRIYNIYNI